MRAPESAEGLWVRASKASSSSAAITREDANLPQAVQRYLRWSIAPGTPKVSTIKLKMHGEIKLNGWHPFVADQVICWKLGMIWEARVRMYGLPISGSDRLLQGRGSMHWNLFGILPLMHAEGTDITRSSAGRMNIESLWLPSVLCGSDVNWTSTDENHIVARFTANKENVIVNYTISDTGELESVTMPRWGNAGGGSYRLISFGALVARSGTFGGFTIPVKLRVGWFFGTPQFESRGEFFRVEVDDVEYT